MARLNIEPTDHSDVRTKVNTNFKDLYSSIGDSDSDPTFTINDNTALPTSVGTSKALTKALLNDMAGMIKRITGNTNWFITPVINLRTINTILNVLGYEEGTFTPILYGSSVQGTNVYDIQEGYYIKVGHLVFVTFQIRLTSKDTAMAGTPYVKGLPFIRNANANIPSIIFNSTIDNVTLNTDNVAFLRSSFGNSTYLDLRQKNIFQGSSTNIDIANIMDNISILANGVYVCA